MACRTFVKACNEVSFSKWKSWRGCFRQFSLDTACCSHFGRAKIRLSVTLFGGETDGFSVSWRMNALLNREGSPLSLSSLGSFLSRRSGLFDKSLRVRPVLLYNNLVSVGGCIDGIVRKRTSPRKQPAVEQNRRAVQTDDHHEITGKGTICIRIIFAHLFSAQS